MCCSATRCPHEREPYALRHLQVPAPPLYAGSGKEALCNLAAPRDPAGLDSKSACIKQDERRTISFAASTSSLSAVSAATILLSSQHEPCSARSSGPFGWGCVNAALSPAPAHAPQSVFVVLWPEPQGDGRWRAVSVLPAESLRSAAARAAVPFEDQVPWLTAVCKRRVSVCNLGHTPPRCRVRGRALPVSGGGASYARADAQRSASGCLADSAPPRAGGLLRGFCKALSCSMVYSRAQESRQRCVCGGATCGCTCRTGLTNHFHVCSRAAVSPLLRVFACICPYAPQVQVADCQLILATFRLPHSALL